MVVQDAQNNEIDVFFYDESGELIDLEEDIIYKYLKKANYFIYDFLSEKFYPFEDIVIKIGLKNQKINVKNYNKILNDVWKRSFECFFNMFLN